MRRLALVVFCVATAAHGACKPEDLLAGARAIVKSHADPAVRERLEACFADTSANERDRTTAAYLLTLGELADVMRPAEPHLAYLSENESRWKYLSNEARLRVRRILGDNAYESAKFKDAERAYEKLADETSGDVREYAITKLGWTYMNQNAPDRARSLWSRESKARAERGEAPQTTWLHGWSQAFVESGGRASSDVETWCRFAKGKDGDDAKLAIVRGAADGVPVAKLELLRRAAEGLAACPALYEAFLVEAGERFAGSSRACGLLAVAPVGTPFRLVRSIADPCRRRLETKQDDPSKLSAEARDAIRGLQLTADDRAAAFLLAYAARENENACGIAVDSLTAHAERRDQKALDVAPTATVEACTLAIEARPALAVALATRLEQAAFRGKPAGLDDPRVYVTSRLLDVPAFRTAFVPKLSEKSERWRSTVYPALVAERIRTDDSAAATNLYEAYVSSRPVKDPAGAVWEELRIERVTKLVDENKNEDALALLRRDAPADRVEGRELRAWLRALGSAPKPLLDKYSNEVTGIANKALDSKDGRERLAAMELLARAEKLDGILGALPKLAPKDDVPLFSDAVVLFIFDAAVQGKISPSTRLQPPELASLVEAGRAVAANKVPTTRKAKAPKRALPESVARLAGFGQRVDRASSAKGDGTAIVSRWVDVLAEGQRLVEKTTWPHAKLAVVARTTLHDFCQSRSEALWKIRRPSQLSAAEWGMVTAELGKQLGACAEAHRTQDSETGGTR